MDLEPHRELVLFRTDEVKTPPFGKKARIAATELLGLLIRGQGLSMPKSRPMAKIGKDVHKLRAKDNQQEWRLIYRIDDDAIVVAHIFKKKTRTTPKKDTDLAMARFKVYDDTLQEG